MFFLHEKQDPGLIGVYRVVGESASSFLDDGDRIVVPTTDGSSLAAELQSLFSFGALADEVQSLGSAR